MAYLVLLGKRWQSYALTPMIDPSGYIDLARNSRFFYDSGNREPLYIFMVKLALRLFRQEQFALRLLSLFWTWAAFIIVLFATRVKRGFWAAIISAMALAFNAVIGYYSCQGFNMTAYSCLLFCFGLIWCWPGFGSRRFWVLGILSGAMALIRLEGLVVAGFCLGWDFALNRGSNLIGPLKAVAVCGILAAPYLITQKASQGSFLQSHAGHAQFWVDRKISLDVASASQNQSAGSWRSFFLGQGAGPFLRRWAKGYVLGFTWYWPRLWQGALWVLPLAMLGFFLMPKLVLPRMLFFLAAALFPVAYILPLDQIGPGSGVEIRFVLFLAWPTAFLAGFGFDWLRITIVGLWRKNFHLMLSAK